MIYILVALLLNNHILVNYNNNNQSNILNLKEILESKETNDIMDVDKMVKKYMLIYGIDNVRGGSYNNDVLEEWQIKSLEHELKLLKFNNEKYINEFDDYNETDINIFINEIIIYRNRIKKLKEMDIQTNFNFNINNIIIAFSKNDQLNKLKNQFNIESGNRRLGNPVRDKLIKIEQQIRELNEEINKVCGEEGIYNIIHDINNKYVNYLRYSKIDNSMEDNNIIKLYSVKIFNTQIKKKLQKFTSPYGSTEEEIIKKYQELLQRKLSLLTF